MPADLAPLFVVCLALLAAGLTLTLAMIARARRAVGQPIAAEHPQRRARQLALIGAQAIALALVLARRDLPLELVIPCLILAATLAAIAPGFSDAICGETGVQRGWYARRFEDLEEWRMIGEHLRFRLFGEWTSVPLPPNEQPKIREKLLTLCPARESRFKD